MSSVKLDSETSLSVGGRLGTVAETVVAPLWVVIGLAMGPAVALGLARFAYALLLPPMRADLGWSFAEAGAMNTANAGGYLAGALMAVPIGKLMGEKRVFAASLLLTALAIGVSGNTASFSLLLGARLIAGFTGALAFVSGAGLTSAAVVGSSRSRAETLLGVYFAGAGVGVTASALLIPSLLGLVGWRGGWVVLGGLALIAALFGGLALRHVPELSYTPTIAAQGGWSLRFMAHTLLAYGLFGAGYIAYATFIIAYLRNDEGFSAAQITVFWSLLGLVSVAAAFAWGPILGRLKGGWGTAATIGVVMVGAAMPLLWEKPAGAYLSAILFGGSFLAVVAAATSLARRTFKPQVWTAAVAVLTVAFGIGQCIGPVLSGALSDGATGVRAGLWLSVGILAVASIVALFQREPRVEHG